jgi:hypothetical protein
VCRRIAFVVLSGVLLIALTACGAGDAPQAAAPPTPAALPTDLPPPPLPTATRVSTLPTLEVRRATPAPGSTVVVPPPSQDPSDTFLIFGLRATPSGSPEAYQQAVTEAAVEHLAARLAIPAEAIEVVARGYVEAQAASPCGLAPKAATGAAGGGLAVGYEVVLRAGSVEHRYIAVGGRGYYCGEG